MSWLKGPGRLALVMGLGLSLGAGSALGAGEEQRLKAFEEQAAILGTQIEQMQSQLSAFMPKVDIGARANAPTIEVAQSSRESASINVRLGQIEEQMRVLNGQVDGLQFQMTQMQTLLERQQQDYEFRFEQLEGSSSGKISAAPQSGGAMLPGGVPQSQNTELTGVNRLDAPDNPDIVIDPQAEGFELGTPERPLGTLDSRDLDLSGQPLDLQGGAGDLVTQSDANAQYRAGYDAVVRGDYDFAEEQFRQFVDLFPGHAQAPEAANWLGEALIQRGEYDEAADVLLNGFQSYSDSPRAPDLLLKLGIALAGAGEVDTACRTFGEVQRRFANQPASFLARLKTEMGVAGC